MSKIYSGVEINQSDLDDQGSYIGAVDLTDTNLSVDIAPDLGIVHFVGDVKTLGRFSIGHGTSVKVSGHLETAKGITAGGCIEVSGTINAGPGLRAEGSICAGRYIYCGGDIYSGGDIKAGKDVSAFGFIRAEETINCSASVSARLGRLSAGKNIIVNGAIKAKTCIIAGGDIRCWSGISAGTFICASGLLHVDGSIQAGNRIYADTVVCGESVIAKGSVEVVHSLSSSRDIQAGHHIKAWWIHASRIFAGLSGELPLPGEVRGEILHGVLAYGQHVAA